MEKFTEDLNIIRSLPDNPALTSDEFKSKFDEAGKKIKEYLNNIVGPEIESKAGEAEMTQLNKKIDDSLAELESEVNTALETLTASVNKSISDMQTSLNSSVSSLNTNVGKKTSYGDFLITRNSFQSQSGGIVSTSSRNADLYHSVSQSGYYPIALVGVRGTSTEDKFDYRHGYLSNQANGSCIAHWIFTNNEGGSFNANDLPACEIEILWVKVR